MAGLDKLWHGYWQARRLLEQFRPDAVLATGGFVSVPVVCAARSVSCPSLVYLPDMQPGLAVRLLSRFSERIAVSFESVARYFPSGKVVVSGYPVRKALFSTTGTAARQALGLEAEAPVLLVFGGSRGARSINEAVRASLGDLLRMSQVLHISGPEDYQRMADLAARLPAEAQNRYHLCSYMYEHMTAALAAADLVVARAGAATLGEFPAVGLPSILVPYPYAGQHQQVNAQYMAKHGASLVIQDTELSARLAPTVGELLRSRERLAAMSRAARSLAVPGAAATLAAELCSLAQARHQG
jgi:UDP-N-acetylglucosamine--N-acetylmuramyl-(pentapeptide) pyrophosphoryl-undecaprenol N-acetylglucosamine transferase